MIVLNTNMTSTVHVILKINNDRKNNHIPNNIKLIRNRMRKLQKQNNVNIYLYVKLKRVHPEHVCRGKQLQRITLS